MRIYRFVKTANDAMADFALRVMSWAVWLNVLTVGVALWLAIDQITSDHFDPQKTTLVLVLTIQTALSAEAANLRNRRDKAKEDTLEVTMRAQIDSIETLAVDIKRVADSIASEQDRTRERDEQSLQRDAVLIDLSAELVLRLEQLKGQA